MWSRVNTLIFFLLCFVFGNCTKIEDSKRQQSKFKNVSFEFSQFEIIFPGFFSLFNVVSFENNLCQGSLKKQPSEIGTCFTSEECTSKGGVSIGNCASGFGVCCQFKISKCGSSINENCSYVTNEGFPSTFQSASNCVYKVQNQRPIICQLRLDFLVFDLEKSAGVCNDGLTIDGPTRRDPRQLCGQLAGQHVYVETGRSRTPTTLTFDAGDDDSTWRIKITYLECNNLQRYIRTHSVCKICKNVSCSIFTKIVL